MYQRAIGGGGNTIASGTNTSISATNTEYTIATGLSEIHKFVLCGSKLVGSTGSISMYIWDADIPTVFNASCSTSNEYGKCQRNANLGIASTVRTGAIVSVNGGNVKFRTATNDAWVYPEWDWFAY